MKIKFKRLDFAATIPHKATPGAAAYDLYAIEDAYVAPGVTVLVRTGICMELPPGWKGEIYSRSGLASQGLVVANSPGKIDADYRGEIKVALLNTRNEGITGIEAGTRIAQFEINPVHDIEFEEVEELAVSQRGSSGFGSTGR